MHRENCINVKRDAVILAWFGLNALKSVNNGRKNDDKE